MRRWHLTGLVVVAAALFLDARPATAQVQVWFGGNPVVRPVPPVWGAPPVWGGTVVQPVPPVWGPPVWGAPGIVQPVPPIGVVPGPGWGTTTYWAGRPTWAMRRAYRQARRW
jgi:hypothetical protein